MIKLKSNFARSIEDMITYKKALGYSEFSCKHYLHDFDNHCAESFPNKTELTQEVVMNWCHRRNGEAINSLNRRLAAIREFGRYLQSIGIPAYIMPPKMTATQTKYVPHIYRSRIIIFFLWRR